VRPLAGNLKLKTVNGCGSLLVTSYLSLPLKISAGQLFELLLPLSYLLTVMISTWVLAGARKRRFSVQAVTLWTLGTLFFPLIILPLYLITRSFRRPTTKQRVDETEGESPTNEAREATAIPLRRLLPAAYLLVMLFLGALHFYTDWKSVDAHLARANQARVGNERERVIAEYRLALALEDDAHTHNLLGKEFMAALSYAEALAEFRTAERMGELDEELAFNIAVSLDQLHRPAEARGEYEKFLTGALCRETPHDVRCGGARQRLAQMPN
jgi:hypothetical protein